MDQDLKRGPRRRFSQGLVGFLGSVRLAIAILTGLTLLSVVGTVVPQIPNLGSQAVLATFPLEEHPILHGLGLFHLFHTPLFAALLVLLGVNLTVCSVRSLPRRMRAFDALPPGAPPPGALLLRVTGPDPADRLGRWKCHPGREGWSAYRHGSLGLFGSTLTHLGFLVVLLGALWNALAAETGQVAIPEGGTVRTFHDRKGRELPLGAELKLEKFTIQRHGDGSVARYLSRLLLQEPGRAPRSVSLEVNRPLRLDRYRLLQSFEYPDPSSALFYLQIRPPDDPLAPTQRIRLLDDRWVPLLDSAGTEARVVRLFTHLEVNDGKPGDRPDSLANPAVLLRFRRNGQELGEGWVFQQHPGMNRLPFQDPTLTLVVETARHVSGLQVVRNPGFLPVALGSLVVIAGLWLILFLPEQRIWIRPDGSNWELAGWASRNRTMFARELIESTRGEVRREEP